MTAEKEADYRAALEAALRAGYAALNGGGSALDAVERAVVSMEDCPLFNAGRGSCFTADGRIEMDAAIVDGATRAAGAVAAVAGIGNPILAARAVMEHSPHVFLIGEGAQAFARERGLQFESPEYFETEFRRAQWRTVQATGRPHLDHSVETETANEPIGTVGAVAVDAKGNLAAATSTGGMTNKRFGRIGDSPIVGAGTYADNAACAVSATGHGEYFIRAVAAYDVAARMIHGGADLEAAAAATLRAVGDLGGEGGLIAIDASGRFALPFNSEGMYRGWTDDAGEPKVAIYRAKNRLASRNPACPRSASARTSATFE
jgi:beta-aspartyl-peptidase (threonine type)